MSLHVATYVCMRLAPAFYAGLAFGSIVLAARYLWRGHRPEAVMYVFAAFLEFGLALAAAAVHETG
jgi:hypothetical protein